MKRLAVLLFASVAATPALHAAEVQIVAQNPVIELSVYEQIEVEPDMATMSTGVQSEAPTAVEALRRNSAEMDRLVSLIRALGIAERDIQTSRINLNPRYDYNRDNQPPRFIGYQANNQVTVKLRDIDRVPELLDAMVEGGATNLNGPYFSIQDDTQAKAEARRSALERGRRQAEEYAQLNGFAGVRLLQVGEAIQGSVSGPENGAIVVTGSRMARVAAPPPPPVAPGVVGTGVGVRLTYEMTR